MRDPKLDKLEGVLAEASIRAQGITEQFASHEKLYVRAITHNLQRQIDEAIETLQFLWEALEKQP